MAFFKEFQPDFATIGNEASGSAASPPPHATTIPSPANTKPNRVIGEKCHRFRLLATK